jgi:hypothetical protein
MPFLLTGCSPHLSLTLPFSRPFQVAITMGYRHSQLSITTSYRHSLPCVTYSPLSEVKSIVGLKSWGIYPDWGKVGKPSSLSQPVSTLALPGFESEYDRRTYVLQRISVPIILGPGVVSQFPSRRSYHNKKGLVQPRPEGARCHTRLTVALPTASA